MCFLILHPLFIRKMPYCENATALCSEMHKDIKHVLALDKLYPNRIKIVRYEDLNVKRNDIMNQTYNFLNLTINGEAQLDHLYTLYKTNNKKKQFGKKRSLVELAKRWMIMLSKNEAMEIQDSCKEVLRLLGYPSREDAWKKEKLVVKPRNNMQHIIIQ